MTHRGSRFFDGYQLEQTPEGKKKLHYTAQWYGFARPGQQRRVKAVVSGLILVTLVCYFTAQLRPSPGGMARYMAIPSLLSLVPMIFLLMGFVNFLLAKDAWELRVYYSGYRRLFRAAVSQLVLFALWLLGEGFYTGTHLEGAGAELGYLCCALVCTGAMVALVVLIRRNPVQVVRSPEIK